MAINIFSLVGEIMIEAGAAEQSVQKVMNRVEQFAETLGNGIKTAGKWAAGIATAAASAAAAAGAALNSAVNDTAEYADEIDKASYRSGLGAENLQRLKYAAEQSGATLENLEKSAKKMNERLGEVTEGNEKSAAMFEALGVAVTNADGSMRDSDSVYNDVLNALADMGDTAEATAIGTDLFGKAFVDLKPLLAAGSEGINDLKENADKLGIVMSQDAVTAGVVYGDTLANIQAALGGAARSIGAAALPAFQKFADKIITYIPKIQSFINNLIPIVENLAESIIDPLMEMLDELLPPLLDFAGELLKPIGNLIRSVLPTVIQLLNKLIPVVTDIIKELLPPAVEILDALMPLLDIVLEVLDPILDLVKALIRPIGDVLRALEPVISAVVEMIDFVLKPFQSELGNSADALENIFGGALEFVCNFINTITIPALNGFVAFLNGDLMGGVEGFGNAFIGVFNNIFSAIDGIFGTHLSEWYAEVQSFWMDVGSKLYQMTNQDLLEVQELSTKYSSMNADLNAAASAAIKGGATAEEAVEKAKAEVLDTAEKLYAFEQLSGNAEYGFTFDAAKAQQWYNSWNNSANRATTHSSAEYYAELGRSKLPKLATGGIVYGDTLAQIGDNPDAHVNPEVVAPLSELTAMTADAFDGVAEKIAAAIAQQIQQQPINLTVTTRLSDDTELTRTLIRNINDCTRQDGKCVIQGI